MKINRHIHQTLRLKYLLATILLIALLIATAWLSRHYSARIDLSTNASNTLSQASIDVLKQLNGTINVKAYIHDPNLTKLIKRLLEQYQNQKNDFNVEFIDPTQFPELAREHNIGPQGAILLEYQGRNEKITYLDETRLTNALLRLAENQKRWITFLSGHGEPSVDGQANFDYGLFAAELAKRGIRAQSINLAQMSALPDNSSLLVLPSPRVELLPGELEVIASYIDAGGNVLLLSEPGNTYLDYFELQLGINKLPGKIVDTRSRLYGIDDPTFVLVSEYAHHPVTQNFKNITVFPVAAALQFNGEDSEFRAEALLSSVRESWTESGPISGNIRFDADGVEREGPLDFAFALTRPINTDKQQRIIIIGDGDFISNAYLNNVGNLELGLRMINWLTENDRFIEIPAKMTPGRSLQLSTTSIAVISVGFLIILPATFLLAGLLIWHKRKKR